MTTVAVTVGAKGRMKQELEVFNQFRTTNGVKLD